VPASAVTTAATTGGVRVPDVIAQPLARAATVLRAAGLRGVASDRDPSVASAVVVAQEPAAGRLVPAGSVVGFRTRTDLQPNGRLRRLRLARGATTATYPLVAPDPARHRLTVVVGVSRAADLQVWVETGAGTRLAVLGGDGQGPAGACLPVGGQAGPVRCVARFGGLDAEGAGVWAVNLFKRSSPPVSVEVTVTFTAL
jgi:PASTA domain